MGTHICSCSGMKADVWMLIPKALRPLPHAAAAKVTLPLSLTGAARAKLESRSHTSPQDVINLPSQCLLLAALALMPGIFFHYLLGV